MQIDVPTACVIGWPITHSRSPLIHRHWLTDYGISGDYIKHAVEPDDLRSFVADLRDGRFIGCNVTMPHKESIADLIDEVLPEARAIGAINTIWRDGGRLVGTSTDGIGFVSHLDTSAAHWRTIDGPVVVLGAGGAARAIVDAILRTCDHDVVLLNRTRARADDLVLRMSSAQASSNPVRLASADWSERDTEIAGASLVINTTSLGMTGQPPLDVSLKDTRKQPVVADIVYAPLETSLLAEARREGLPAVDGLGMLLHQAVPGFERWFGVVPEVMDDLRRMIVADLDQSA